MLQIIRMKDLLNYYFLKDIKQRKRQLTKLGKIHKNKGRKQNKLQNYKLDMKTFRKIVA